ncbi:MAG: hypothetical protein IJY28_00540 [Clostridia bacterium]|nr:hypothetical protein [Clostridia bacterium]
MAKFSRMIRKLQTAILQQGGMVKVNTRQFYSEDQQRMITGYSVMVPEWDERKQKTTDREQLFTCSAVEVVKLLAAMLEGLRNEPES